ncbi:MAG: AMP-binding protein [Planctomycetes bacterium]|nr:AMP-binding protein [Planctomycetota bacterium]
MNVFDTLDRGVAVAAASPALVQDDQVLSYAVARTLALAVAADLRLRGIGAGDRVGCLCLNSIEHFLAYHAVAAAGAILVSLNTRLAIGEQREILGHSGTTLLLHDDEHRERANELAPCLRAGTVAIAAAMRSKAATTDLPIRAPADDTAHLYYTSGTTGRPKGVMLSHRNVVTHADAAIAELGLCATDRWAHIAPMFHLADAWATFAISAVGGTHVFLPRFQPALALDLLAHHRITITNLVPTMLNLMVKEPDAAARTFALRTMLSGGAPIAPATVRQILATFRCDYVQTYGMTETSPYLTLSLLTDAVRALPQNEQLRMKCRTGRPFAGVDLRVVDDAGVPVPADDRTVGEIRVRGATVTPGYWQDPAATAAAFDRDGFLCTGDLATLDRFGYVNIVDRKKDVIKTGGEAVYSTEVENVLMTHPAVLECAVYGTPEPTWGELVSAAIVLRPGAKATAEAIIAFCRDQIAHYKAPRRIHFLATLPKTGSGKIQKRLLRDTPGG